MRFLVDECTGPGAARWLEEHGHEVFLIRGAEDEEVLRKATAENRIVITNDKRFGDMIFRERKRHVGTVLLRLSDEHNEIKIAVLERVLARFAGELSGNFVVASEDNIRIVRFGGESG